MSIKSRIAFIGLGVMGGPIAGHLARAGYHVTAYNRTHSRAAAWLEAQQSEGHTVALAPSPALAARTADIVMSCVGNDDDLAEVALGPEGMLAAMQEGALFIDHTTVSARMARRLAEQAAARAIDALDAPVSGGEAGAINGQLAIMCGGSKAAMRRAHEVMDCYAKSIVHVGTPGAGQSAKMVNQMCIAGVLAGLSEAVRLAEAAGLDMDKTYEAIAGGAAQSWQMDNRWASMAKGEFDFGFAINWMRKDLAYALAEARALGLSSPITALVDQFYAEIEAAGGGRQDTSALITRLPKGAPAKDRHAKGQRAKDRPTKGKDV